MSMKKAALMRENGFTLLELLISLVILSVGLLGLAGLQMTGLKNNHSAQYRTSASVQAYDIIEMMRLNRAVAQAGGYDIALADAAPTGADLEDTDIASWLTALANTLPSGDGAVATSGRVTTVTIQWDDSRGTDGSNTQAFRVSTEL